ncbi:hypothetical protein BDEG_24901 [Batrachochytrium dendrobatidis JEL423]|uniref:TOG domain-containing protein n=2 Tax=Batrachochytrium dendrobatidis (strain JEL423) TaxID=403673 RepID=A0A177WMC1_BATDL|nr:hypothetical protein BDEG_24901 [Batrachochytrium dendrobatidis JEL423]
MSSKIPYTIELSNAAALEYEVKQMAALFEQRESEENWTKFEEALLKLTAITRGSHQLSGFTAIIKTRLKTALINCLSTERTRLARTAMLLVEALGSFLKERFDALSDPLMSAVLKLTARANRVYVSTASSTLKSCIESSGAVTFIPTLADALKNASKTMRIAAMECICAVIRVNSVDALSNYIVVLENVLRESVVDSTNEVRSLSRDMFDTYRNRFPDRVDRFVDDLPEIARKYIKIEKSKSGKLSSKPRPISKGYSHDNGLGVDDASLNTPSLAKNASTLELDRLALVGESTTTSAQSTVSAPVAFGGPRRVLGEPARVISSGSDQSHADQPRSTQGRMTFLTEHLGGAQRVVRPEKPVANVTSVSSDFTGLAKFKPMRIPPTSTNTHSSSRPTSFHSEGSRPASQASTHSVSSKLSSESLANASDFSQPRRAATVSRINQSNMMYQGSSAANHRKAGSMVSLVTPSQNLTGKIKRNHSTASVGSTRSLDKSRHSQHSINLAKLKTDMRNSDWSTRLNSLQFIANHFTTLKEKGEALTDLQTRTELKILDLVLQGITDAHFRVVHTALQATQLFVESIVLPRAVIEQVLVKVSSIYYNPNLKNKHGVGEISANILSLCRDKYAGDVLCEAIIQDLNNPEYAIHLKMRVGCIGFLSDLNSTHWKAFLSKPASCKLMMNRLITLTTETDPFFQRCLKFVIQTISELGGESFWTAIKSLRSIDKKAIDALFGGDIEHDKSILASVVKPTKIGQSGSPANLPHKTTPRSYSSVSPKVSAKNLASYLSPSRSQYFKNSDELVSGNKDDDSLTTVHSDTLSRSSSRPVSMMSYSDDQFADEGSTGSLEKHGWLHADNIDSVTGLNGLYISPRLDDIDRQATPTPRYDMGSLRIQTNDDATPHRHIRHSTASSASSIERHTLLNPDAFDHASYDMTSSTRLATHIHAYYDPHLQQPTPEAEDVMVTNGFEFAAEFDEPTTDIEFDLVQPDILEEVLFSDDSLQSDFRFITFDSNVSSKSLEGLVRVSRKRRRSLWGSCAGQFVQVILDALANESRLASSIRNALIMLRELISNQTEFILEHATEILSSVLRYEPNSHYSKSEKMDILLEVDSVLATFENRIQEKQLLQSSIALLKMDIDKRFCFELLTRHLAAMDNDSLWNDMEQDDIIFYQLASGLNSKKSATRKAAYDCALTIQTQRGEKWCEQLYSAIRKSAGIPREIVVRSMMGRMRISADVCEPIA